MQWGFLPLLELLPAILGKFWINRLKEPETIHQSENQTEESMHLDIAAHQITKAMENAPDDFKQSLDSLLRQTTTIRQDIDVFEQKEPEGPDPKFVYVEKIFTVLQILSAAFVAFAHGSNDVANAIGPLAGIIGIINQKVGNCLTI